jgi:hypothetical protein
MNYLRPTLVNTEDLNIRAAETINGSSQPDRKSCGKNKHVSMPQRNQLTSGMFVKEFAKRYSSNTNGLSSQRGKVLLRSSW